MNKAYWLALGAATVIGCGDSKHAATQTVSGFTVDIDKLAGYYAMNPNASAQDIIMHSCVANTPVYGLYEDGSQTATVTAGADCTYTLTATRGKTIHLVAAENQTTKVLNTYSQDATPVADSPLQQIPAHVCTSNQYSAPVGVAALLGVDVTQVEAHGICMFGTNDVFTPPFVKLTPSKITSLAPGSFKIYALTDPTTQPPTFVHEDTSPTGIYGVYDDANAAVTTVSIQAQATSGTNTYVPFTCDVRPGFITFAPENPN